MLGLIVSQERSKCVTAELGQTSRYIDNKSPAKIVSCLLTTLHPGEFLHYIKMLWDGVVATLHDVKECRVPVGVCVSGDGESEKYVKALYKSKPLLSNKVRPWGLGQCIPTVFCCLPQPSWGKGWNEKVPRWSKQHNFWDDRGQSQKHEGSCDVKSWKICGNQVIYLVLVCCDDYNYLLILHYRLGRMRKVIHMHVVEKQEDSKWDVDPANTTGSHFFPALYVARKKFSIREIYLYISWIIFNIISKVFKWSCFDWTAPKRTRETETKVIFGPGPKNSSTAAIFQGRNLIG